MPNLIIATGNPTVKTTPIKIIKIPIGEKISTPCPVFAKSIFLTYNVSKNSHKTLPFYLYPRSSISKTPLMLANHTGIIDSGYRGNLKVAMRSMYFDETDSYTVSANSRLVQICDPTLKPIYVVIVDESELSNTERGEGGFGSTGK